MKKGWYLFASAAIVAAAVTLFFYVSPKQEASSGITRMQDENYVAREENESKEQKENEQEQPQYYLSIVYTTADSSVESGRMMNFYAYDIDSGRLDKKAEIPFNSQYALGAVDLNTNKIYYSSASEEKADVWVDHLYEYDLETKKSKILETENRAYNDIIPLDGKLLVTTIPVHAIGTAMFDLDTKKFSFLFKKKLNEWGYKDFLDTTRPVPLFYNVQDHTFVNVSVKEKALYSNKVRSGKKPLKVRIAVVDSGLKIKNEYTFALPSLIQYEVAAVARESENKLILMVNKDIYKEDDPYGYKNIFYKIDLSKQSCKKIKSPFPEMEYIYSFVTLDNGKSYFIEANQNEEVSGLFHYDCSNDEVTPVLLNGPESHVVNFCPLEVR